MLTPYSEVQGQGPDLVLLHGWGLHSDIFAGIMPQLSQHYRVHSIDLPGFGRSPVSKSDYTLEYLIEQVLSVAPESAHWLGWSMGGMLAMAIAARKPQRVEKLITVAASPKFIVGDNWPHAMKPDVLASFMGFLAEDFRGTIIRFLAIQTMGSETQKDDLSLLKELVFRHGEPAPKALKAGLELLQNTDLLQELSSIQSPWLRVYGKLDGLVPSKSSEILNESGVDGKTVIFPKSSHGPFISHRDEFMDCCLEFLDETAL